MRLNPLQCLRTGTAIHVERTGTETAVCNHSGGRPRRPENGGEGWRGCSIWSVGKEAIGPAREPELWVTRFTYILEDPGVKSSALADLVAAANQVKIGSLWMSYCGLTSSIERYFG